MIEIIKNILIIIYAVICVCVIVLSVIQTKDSGGASGTITGSSANNYYDQNKGKSKQGKLKRLTIISGVLFVVVGLVLSVLFVM